MEKEPRISVVMSVYNAAEFLREAVDSILNQTFSDFEFIIIDDKSTDDSLKILKSYIDPRIILVINDKNIGLTKNLNEGIKLAKGEFIARMDADDISLPQRFEKQVIFLDTNPHISLSGTQVIELGLNTVSKFPITSEEIKFSFLHTNSIAHPTVLFRKNDFVKFSLIYDENYLTAQDYELWTRAISILNFSNLEEPLLKLRIHANQISKTKSINQNHFTKMIKQNLFETLFFKLNKLDLETHLCAFDNGFLKNSNSAMIERVDDLMSRIYIFNKTQIIFDDNIILRFWILQFFGNRLYRYDLMTFRKIMASKLFIFKSVSVTIQTKLLLKSLINYRIDK
jgi:glycosyltransferase involved in cell wall biosynthesis